MKNSVVRKLGGKSFLDFLAIIFSGIFMFLLVSIILVFVGGLTEFFVIQSSLNRNDEIVFAILSNLIAGFIAYKYVFWIKRILKTRSKNTSIIILIIHSVLTAIFLPFIYWVLYFTLHGIFDISILEFCAWLFCL